MQQHVPADRGQQAQYQHSGAVHIQQQALHGIQYGSFDPMLASGHHSSSQVGLLPSLSQRWCCTCISRKAADMFTFF